MKRWKQDKITNLYPEEWYELFIEEPVRIIVKEFHRRGLSTIGSCGHDLTIVDNCTFKSRYYSIEDKLFLIHYTLTNLGYDNYRVHFEKYKSREDWIQFLVVFLPDINGQFSEIRISNPEFIKNNCEKIFP